MGTQYIEHPVTKEKIPFEWNSDTPPTSDDIEGLFQAVSSQGSDAKMPPVPAPTSKPWYSYLDPRQAMMQTYAGAASLGRGVGNIVSGAVKATGLEEPFVQSLTDLAKQIKGTEIGGFVAEGAGRGINYLQSNYPESSKVVGQGIDILNLLPGAGAAKTILPTVGKVDTALAGMLPSISGKDTLDKVVRYGFTKGIKPTIVGKSDAGLVKKYFENAKTGVQSVIENTPGLAATIKASEAPIEEFSMAIRSTKQKVWDKSSSLASSAGAEGALTPITPVRIELQKIIDAPNVLASEKRIASKWLKELSAYGDAVPPPVVEDLLAKLNARTQAFWKNPNPNAVTDAATAEWLAKQLRAANNKVIETYQGPGWQTLRKEYGALSAIEKGVTDRATIAARQSVKGFFDLTDVSTAGEFVRGLASLSHGDLAGIAGAASRYAMKRHIKEVNNVNNIVRNMIVKADDIIKAGGGTPRMIESQPAISTAPRARSEAGITFGIPEVTNLPQGPPASMPLRGSVASGRGGMIPPASYEQGVTFGVPKVTPNPSSIPNIAYFQDKYNRLKALPATRLSSQDWEFIKAYETAVGGSQ